VRRIIQVPIFKKCRISFFKSQFRLTSFRTNF
jgi:hypothetical protein